MANTYTYKRTTTDKLTVKGFLSEDGSKITYLEKIGIGKEAQEVEREITLEDCAKDFCGGPIELTFTKKDEEDLLGNEE